MLPYGSYFWYCISVDENHKNMIYTSALILISEYYFKWPLELGVAIGTFVGFLGSDYISLKIKQVINLKVEGKSDDESK